MNKDPSTAEEASGLAARVGGVISALALLVVAWILGWLRPNQVEIAGLFALAGALVAAGPVFFDAVRGWRAEGFAGSKFYLDQFISLAVLACLATGQFTVAAVVAVILVGGQLLEERTMLGARRAIDGLVRMGKVTARRKDEAGETEVAATDLVPGDLVVVRPGETVAADGVVKNGHSAVNQAPITGESLPVEVQPGSSLFAGCTNLSGVLVFRVTKVGDNTALGRARAVVEEARSTRAPILRLTEKYAVYYTPFVLLLAGFVWFASGELERAISVIIVSIPCALILAGPTAMVAALASATRLGILIKGVRFLEEVRHLRTVVFDKTGTLTTGRLEVSGVVPAAGLSEEEVLESAGAMLHGTRHPVAEAVRAKLRELPQTAEDGPATLGGSWQEVPGCGVEGMRDGTTLRAGRSSWLAEKGVQIPAQDALEGSNGSEMHLAEGNRWIGCIRFQDRLRPEAREILRDLHHLGVHRILMVTGDRAEVANRIAQELNLQLVHAACLPEEKVQVVRSEKERGGGVLVVGDGINDAPALAAGDVSVAMGALGSDIAIQTADMALMSDDLHRLPSIYKLSRQTMRIIEQNLAVGGIFILLSAAAAAAGFVSPLGAALLHEVGAFYVLANSARLLKFPG
jgi:Cd2+/Zn2+-exporting ATPase